MKKRIGISILILSLGVFLLIWGLFSHEPMLSSVLLLAGIIFLGLSSFIAVPILAKRKTDHKNDKVEWRDERNIVIREKAAWYAGMILIAMMSLSAFVLVLVNQLAAACVIAGLLLIYSLSVVAFSSYFNRKL